MKAANPETWDTQAGVGIGIYYDGRTINNTTYPKEWNHTTAMEFVNEVVKQGGNALDMFRLQQGKDDWPNAQDDWWWDILQSFGKGE